MKRRQLIGYISLMAIVCTLTISCNNLQTNSTPDATNLEVAAVANGELTIYSGRNEALIGPLLAKFEAETGTKVNVRYGDTAELAAAILEEGRNTPADVFFGQDAGALGALQNENRAQALPQPILEKVDPRFQSPEGKWIGISGRARVLDYNTQRVQPSELPNSIWELTNEKWRGRVGWAPTNGSFQSFVTALRLLEGDEKTLEWLKAMQANDVQVYTNNMGIVEAVGRGEIDIGLVNNYYLSRFKAENPNFPVAHHYTQDDAGSMINVAGVAIVNESDQGEAALALIEYLLSPESQAYFATETNEYPLVKGSPAPQDQIPLDQINAPPIDLSNLKDLEGTLALLKQSGAL